MKILSRKIFKKIFPCVAFFTLAAILPIPTCATYSEIPDYFDLSILTPELATREIAKIELPNGLKVYLISDPQADQSAAALAVQAGSWDDPEEFPGMAHFCEHMLFLGTKTHPNPREFSKFAADHNGSYNAFTAQQKTVYYFAAEHNAFRELLTHFSEFFTEPLFDTKGMSQELQVVNEEFAKNCNDDMWRSYFVFQETSNPLHPNSRHSIGTSTILSQIPHHALRNWHAKHYQAKRMRLAIYSSLPMSELKALAANTFAQVPTTENLPPIADPDAVLLSSQQKGHALLIHPLKMRQELLLRWEIPSHLANSLSKPAYLLCYAINRGHAASFKEGLIKEGLIRDVHAFPMRWGNAQCLDLFYELTEKGMNQLDTVALRFFEFLQLLREEGLPVYLSHEQNKIAEIEYQWQSRHNAVNMIADIGATLFVDEDFSYYPRQLWFSSYTASEVEELLNALSPSECMVMCWAPINAQLEKQERWAKVPYSIVPIPEPWIQKWTDARVSSHVTLPDPNLFLPEDFSIVENKDPATHHRQEPWGEFYYQRAPQFQSPHVGLYFQFVNTPDFSIRESCLADLAQEMFSIFQVNHLVEAAGQGGCFISSGGGHYAPYICIEGFSDKASEVAMELFREFKNFSPSREQFENTKQGMLQVLTNQSKQLGYQQALSLANSLIIEATYTSENLAKELASISYEDFQNFKNNWLFQKMYIRSVCVGNITAIDAEKLWENVHALFATNSPLPQEEQPQVRAYPLQEGPFAFQSFGDVGGSAVAVLVDGGIADPTASAVQDILSEALGEAFFDELRTNQQTGYLAQSVGRERQHRLFYYYVIQSGTYLPAELLKRVDQFIAQCNVEELIPENRFDRIRHSTLDTLERVPQNLSQQLWDLVSAAYYYKDLEWLDKRLAGIRSLDYATFLEKAKESISSANKRRIAVLYNGTGVKEALMPEGYMVVDKDTAHLIREEPPNTCVEEDERLDLFRN